jgi:hypothetical protein
MLRGHELNGGRETCNGVGLGVASCYSSNCMVWSGSKVIAKGTCCQVPQRMQLLRCGIEWRAWDGRLCRCREGALHARGGVGIHERAIQGAGRHVIGSSAGAQDVQWLGDSGNTGHVNTMQERRTLLHGSEAVWVQKGADVWCVGSCAAAEKVHLAV